MDPTFPLIPVANLFAAFLVLLTFLTSVRQTWNAGVLMICMWLFVYCLIQGFEPIVWSDNADNKAPVWCDISSRIAIGVEVGIPACSLVITRRLCNIARLRTVEPPSKRERRFQCFLDLFIGIGIPFIIMGPCYYVVQTERFSIYGEVGCSPSEVPSGLSIILVDMWPAILPFISATFYCPRIIWTFYHHRKEVNAFLLSNGSVNRARYFRILAVGCFDIVLTLPASAIFLVIQNAEFGTVPFYQGWDYVHHPWAPESISADEWRSDFWGRFATYFTFLLYPFASVLLFSLFGLTGEARTTYRRWFWTAAGLFGSKPTVREDMPDMVFGSLPERRHTRVPGRSLSIPGSSTMNGEDFTLSMHSTNPHEEVGYHSGDLADEVVDVRREEHDGGGEYLADKDAQIDQQNDEKGGARTREELV